MECGFVDGDVDFVEVDYGGYGVVVVDDGFIVEFVFFGVRGGLGLVFDEVLWIEGGRVFLCF